MSPLSLVCRFTALLCCHKVVTSGAEKSSVAACRREETAAGSSLPLSPQSAACHCLTAVQYNEHHLKSRFIGRERRAATAVKDTYIQLEPVAKPCLAEKTTHCLASTRSPP